jgi:hypothetical protein
MLFEGKKRGKGGEKGGKKKGKGKREDRCYRSSFIANGLSMEVYTVVERELKGVN